MPSIDLHIDYDAKNATATRTVAEGPGGELVVDGTAYPVRFWKMASSASLVRCDACGGAGVGHFPDGPCSCPKCGGCGFVRP